MFEKVSKYVAQAQQRANTTVTAHRRPAVLALLLVLLMIPLATDTYFVLNVFIIGFIFVMLGHAWNIIGGYAGQLALGHALLWAVGAYTTAILFVHYGATPIIGLPIGGLIAAVVGLLIGAITFRLRYHYFAMATLASALVGHIFFLRWEFVGGSAGLEAPFSEVGTWYMLTFSNQMPYYYMTGLAALVVTMLVYRIDTSKLGVYLKAINMDQDLAQNAGLNVFWYKMQAMALSSFIAGIAGGFYFLYVLFIDPQSTLGLLRNVDIILVAIIGGVGTVFGPVVGSFVFIPVREYTRTAISGNVVGLDWVVFGFVMILIALYRPGGLLKGGER
jgi:branched-chain amino acid transport system permease protein